MNFEENNQNKADLEQINMTDFNPITSDRLKETLGLTIKHDDENKLVTFLCAISAYTEGSQFNITFNAPSSTGKSYIATEIAKLFPKEDIKEFAYCSPTALYHETGEYDKEKNCYLVDLSRKILILLDQQNDSLLVRLRPLLSHDEKEIALKITEKTEKSGMKAKNIILRGYPSVISCTAAYHVDEQEATRFLILSPETNQDKIQQSISATIRKEADSKSFTDHLEQNPDRIALKARIQAIKQANIKEIKIAFPEEIEKRFLSANKILKPRDQRAIKFVISFVKAFALLNLWWRNPYNSEITADMEDIDAAFNLWEKLAVSQEASVSPYLYEIYKKVILPLWEAKNDRATKNSDREISSLSLSRQEILEKYSQVYQSQLSNCRLRQDILPNLDAAGLITQETDPFDRRKVLVFIPPSPQTLGKEICSERGEGVNPACTDGDFPIDESLVSDLF